MAEIVFMEKAGGLWHMLVKCASCGTKISMTNLDVMDVEVVWNCNIHCDACAPVPVRCNNLDGLEVIQQEERA